MLRIKEIKNYPNYLVDESGRIFSKKSNKYLKQQINKYGYCEVLLCQNGKQKTHRVHRIVATTFIDNPKSLPQVNHIDGNKQNNNLSNLEWVTDKENKEKAIKLGLYDNMKIIQKQRALERNLSQYYVLANEKTKKRVGKFNKNNNLIEEYESISEASRKNNILIASISYSANNKRKTAGGYIWHFI